MPFGIFKKKNKDTEDGPQLHLLRRLFLEYLHPREPSISGQQEVQLYQMLPLFLKVFAGSDVSQMSDRFSDVLQFAGHISKLLVSEIQRRAANKTKQRAVIDVIDFLIYKPNEQGRNGWNLISALHILSKGEVAIIECMVAAALPSTFVKMLRLFFSLKTSYFDEESLSMVQKLIVPTFAKLCNHPVTAKELIRTDDLATLFDALTCSCDPLHVIWRAGVSEILTAITRHCLTKEVVQYIEEKKCISISIANVKMMCVKDPIAIVEMLVTLICVLRDSAEVSSTLLDHFKECGGYIFLSNLLVDFYNSDDTAINEASRNLVILVSSLALSGHQPIEIPASMDSPFQQDGFIIPLPAAGSGLTVRNLDAFIVLQETFLQSKDEDLCLHILHAIQNIFNSDSSNFFVLSKLHTLTLFIEKAPNKPRKVQGGVFKLVEFVALNLGGWVPTQELIAMGILFKNPSLKECQTVALHTLIRLVNQNERLKDVFRKVGLLEVLTSSLKEFSIWMKETHNGNNEDQHKTEKNGRDESMTDFIFLLMECLRLLVENNNTNASFFRQCRGAQYAHSLIPFRCARPYALKIIQQLIVDGGHDDLCTLLGLMHTTKKTEVRLKTDVLNSMLRIFSMSGQTRIVFQEVCGFVYVVAVLVSLEDSLADQAIGCWANVDRAAILELIWAIFQVLTAAMQDEPSNRVIFMDEVRFKGLTDTLKLLGCFKKVRPELPPVTRYCYVPVSCLSSMPLPRIPRSSRDYMKMVVFKCLTSMACSCFENWDIEGEEEFQVRQSMSIKVPRIIHPGAIGAVVELLPSLWEDDEHEAVDIQEEKAGKKQLPTVLINVISQLQHILGSDQNQQMLCEAGLPCLLLSKCKEAFMDDDHPLNAAMTKLFERLTTQSVAPDVLRTFLRLGSPLCSSSQYAMLRPMSRRISSDYDEIDNIDLNKSLNESLDERQRQRAMSLRILNGDIRLSCGSGRATPGLVEENEIDSYLDENSDDTNKRSIEERKRESRPIDSISVSSAAELDPESEAADSSGDNKSLESRDESPEISLDYANEEKSAGKGISEDESKTEERSSLAEVQGEDLKAEQKNEISKDDDENTDVFPERSNGEKDEQVEEKLENKNNGKQSNIERDSDETELPKEENKTGKSKRHFPVQRLVSVESDRLLSGDDEEQAKDRLSIFYEKESTRICERLEGEPPSQNIIKCLVSLTTPRDLLSIASCEQPAFVEFDMSHDGFGFLFIGSLAPIAGLGSSNYPSYSPNEYSSARSTGPVGVLTTGDRTFPPPIGLTFAAWIFIERLPTASSSNVLRLFSVQRRWISGHPKRRFVMKIFTIYLDCGSNEIVVTTDKDMDTSSRTFSRKAATELRAKNDDLFAEGNWNHLCVVLNKSVVRRSTASIYVNGVCVVSTSKFRYIDSRIPSGVDICSARTVAIFGTHATQCHISDLIWRLGPSCLLEDPLGDDAVGVMHKLGPSYRGCFQAPVVSEYYEEKSNDEALPALVPEEKITFMLNAANISSTTLSKLMSQFLTHETSTIAEETCITEEDRFTPVSVIHNSALHFQGPARTLGAVLVGTTGARSFCPNDVASAVMAVGGMPILLSLVAMATNVEELYASLKALTCIVQSSRLARKEMVRIRGYQILGYLLKRKSRLLNTHILHLIFSLVGTVRSDQELGSIPNVIAFNHLLCDFQIWHNAQNELEKSLFCHFFELLTQGSECHKNAECLRCLGCLPKLLYILQDGKPPDSTLQTIASVMSVLLCKTHLNSDLLRFGQFMASILPSSSKDENELRLDDPLAVTPILGPSQSFETSPSIINMRNVLLDVIHNLLHDSETGGIDFSFCEKLHEILGFDWILLFMYGHVHEHTVVRSTRILFIVLSHPLSLNAFRNATSNGGWLKDTQLITNRKTKFAAGFTVPESEEKPTELEINSEASNVKGFHLLMSLFEDHTNVSELYYFLFALLLGYPISGIPPGLNITLESLVLIFWPSSGDKTGASSKETQIYCPDAALVLLHMLRKIMNEPSDDSTRKRTSEQNSHAAVVIQFLEFLYSNIKMLATFCMEKRFLQCLASTLYPLDSKEDSFEESEEEESSSTITNHPSRSQIINFMKHILMDGMIMSPTKSISLLDTVLESFPATASAEVHREYQADVLLAVINDVLDGSLLQPGSSKSSLLSKFASNINSFASKLVDKLWIGIFIKNYEVLFGFLLKMIEKYEDARIHADSLYRTMNRAILYHMSRPTNRITDQTSLLEFLHLLTSNCKIVFSHNNRDEEFIACITHWLLVIGLGKIQSDSDRLSITSEERELLTKDEDEDDDDQVEEIIGDDVGFVSLISSAATRVWDVFYQQKKDEIADVFRVQSLTPSFTSYNDVTVGTGRSMTLDLESAKNIFGEQAVRIWISFISAEDKKRNEAWATPIQQQHVSRNPVTRISMRFRKEKEADEKYTVKESLEWSFRHLSTVKALTRYFYERHQQENLLIQQSAEKNWYAMEKELIRERGIWGPEEDNPLDKWKLGMTEGPRRMRKLMCKHEHFYTNYPFRDENQREQLTKNRTAYSHDSKLLFEICKKYIENDRNITRERTASFTWSPSLCTMEGLEGETINIQVNSQTIVQLLETGEKIYSMYRCARLRGLDSSEGLFLFGKGHFYVIDGFTLLSTEGNKGAGGDIRDIDTLPEGTHEPLVPVAKGNYAMERSFSKWSFNDIKEVHKRRYLQQNIGMELFSNDGNNHLLVFPKKMTRDRVYSRLTQRSSALPRITPEESIAGMRADADVEAGYGFLGGLIGEKHVTQRWECQLAEIKRQSIALTSVTERGEISNFQYLMYLNTLAGRSYNDLMQYPIFPWIIADYDSEELDLTNEKTFRNLSKPMGAQTESRLKQFRERFLNWEDPLNKTPAYYYGTHYSSAMIVASYLIRLEPFTEQFLRLQGGHFDLPDRLFHNIKESWYSASEHTMADVKELIPEFFYLPEFLENQNKFDLGRKQNGTLLDNVILPAWAKGDAREFIRVHRQALECDYVSAHLHEWIDLIFGYRQQGEAAEEVHNVFFHMFYEGAVDLNEIDDPLEKKSTIAVINNFGQMPKQLFKKPHPCKKTLKAQDVGSQTGTLPSQQSSSINDRLFFNNLSSLAPSLQPVKETRAAVGQIIATDKILFAVDAKKVLLAPHYNRYISWGFADYSLRYCSTDDKVLNVFEEVFVGRILCAASLDHGSFVTGGTSTALCVWKIEKYKEKSHRLRLSKVLYGHKAPITSVETSLTYNIIVSGSEDRTAIVWDVRKLDFIRQLPEHPGPITCIAINDVTGDIVTCSSTHLFVWSINGTPIVHETNASATSGQILACAVSEMNEWDANNVIITGSADGIVRMWSIQFYNAAEKTEHPQKVKLYSTASTDSSSQLSRDSKKENNKKLCDTPEEGDNSLEEENRELNASNEKEAASNETEVGLDRSSSAGSNKTMDSFVLVDHRDAQEEPAPRKVWKRRLVLRERKLTMHTAFARSDNLDPAPVTALAISKDNRKIYVGDGRGRIHYWSVAVNDGAIADHWIKDEVAEKCNNCQVRFTLAERRHHCRKCGNIFCAKCSQDKHPVAQLSIFKPVRVCKNCYDELRGRPDSKTITQKSFINSND